MYRGCCHLYSSSRLWVCFWHLAASHLVSEEIWAFCILKEGSEPSTEVSKIMKAKVAQEIGKIAIPDKVDLKLLQSSKFA